MADKLVVPRRYENAADIQSRLDNTFLRYKGEVVYCNFYDGQSVRLATYSDAGLSQPPIVVNSSSVDLDISSIPLGFLSQSVADSPIIARRTPVRKYKQGICSSNISLEHYNSDGEHYTFNNRDVQNIIMKLPFINLLKSKFASADTARVYCKVNSDDAVPHSCSISKDFCFVGFKKRVYLIDHLFEEVGVVDEFNRLVINNWWSTPTMRDHLQAMGVLLKDA